MTPTRFVATNRATRTTSPRIRLRIRQRTSSRTSQRYIVNYIASICLLLGTLGPLIPAQADVYRWVSDNGTVNYGEREPRGREYTVISSNGTETKKDGSKASKSTAGKNLTAARRPTPADAPTASKDEMTDKQQAMLDRMKADEAKRKENLAEVRNSNCASSKRALEKLQTSGRIRVRNEDGQETAMGEDERNEKILKHQESIAVNCDSLS